LLAQKLEAKNASTRAEKPMETLAAQAITFLVKAIEY